MISVKKDEMYMFNLEKYLTFKHILSYVRGHYQMTNCEVELKNWFHRLENMHRKADYSFGGKKTR